MESPFLCDPEGILTLDLQNRNLTLYTAKLRSHAKCLSAFAYANIQIFIDKPAINQDIC